MRFWLAVALLVGTGAGLEAQHEQTPWSARHAARIAVVAGAPPAVPADRRAAADRPLVWRVPWLSGGAAAVLIIGIGVAAEASARELAAEAGER